MFVERAQFHGYFLMHCTETYFIKFPVTFQSVPLYFAAPGTLLCLILFFFIRQILSPLEILNHFFFQFSSLRSKLHIKIFVIRNLRRRFHNFFTTFTRNNWDAQLRNEILLSTNDNYISYFMYIHILGGIDMVRS